MLESGSASCLTGHSVSQSGSRRAAAVIDNWLFEQISTSHRRMSPCAAAASPPTRVVTFNPVVAKPSFSAADKGESEAYQPSAHNWPVKGP